MFCNEAHESVVEVDGTAVLLVGVLRIDHLRMDEVVGVADGCRHIVAHAEAGGDGCGESTSYAVTLPTLGVVGGEELRVLTIPGGISTKACFG